MRTQYFCGQKSCSSSTSEPRAPARGSHDHASDPSLAFRAPTRREQRRSFERAALAAIVALLAVIALQRAAPIDGLTAAHAQPDRFSHADQRGLINPADQRQRIITELSKTNQRLERLLERIGKDAIKVKVVEMPDKPGD